jgi:ribosomal protein S18 acetylase RimI-like enzyme
MTSAAENRPAPGAAADPSFGGETVQAPRKDSVDASGYRISRAILDDIPAIVALQESNLRINGGSLSVRFSPAWFEQAITDMPVIVVRSGGDLTGYVVSTPLTAQAHNPIIRAMLRAYPGSPGAYNYGPICVAQNHRNRGLGAALVEQLRAQLPGREGLTFIRRDNAASLAFHGKIGMRQAAEFVLDDVTYVVVAFMG